MKKLSYKILIVCLMLFSGITTYAYDFEVNGIYYNVTSFTDLTCQVTSGTEKYSGDIVIPAEVEYNNKKLAVTAIDKDAFKDCKELISVKINCPISELNETFYGCSALQAVEIPSSVTYIGSSAFNGCSSLQTIEIPSSVTSIGDAAFKGCSALQAVEIPSSVTYIEDAAFSGCSSLQAIDIPSSVTTIGSSAFSGCSSLQTIEIPLSVTSIGGSAFSDCSSLQTIEIPSSVTTIRSNAFADCSSLQTIEIPSSVTTIGSSAFAGCSSLQTIEIPSSVTSLGELAFSACKSLKSIDLSDHLKVIEYGTFENCQNLSSLTISGSVDKIEQYSYFAFSNNYYTFGNCISLKSLDFAYGPKYLEFGYISSSGFKSDKIMSNLSNALERIFIDRELNYNFGYLNSLKYLTIGEHTGKVCVAIGNADNLERIICQGVIPPSLPAATNKQYMNMEVIVPIGSLDAYKGAEVWKNFWNLREMTPEEAGIDNVVIDQAKIEVARYNLQGQLVNEDYKGLVIVKYSDGSTRKIMNK